MSEARTLESLTDAELGGLARMAFQWWRDEREGWILDRALPVFLAYEENVEWGSVDANGEFVRGEAYKRLFGMVLDHRRIAFAVDSVGRV